MERKFLSSVRLYGNLSKVNQVKLATEHIAGEPKLLSTLKYSGAGIIFCAFIGNFLVPLLCKHPVNVFCFSSEYSGTILHAKPCLPRSSRWNVLSIPEVCSKLPLDHIAELILLRLILCILLAQMNY